MSVVTTVVVVTFNSSSTIERCLLSLNAQSSRSFEVVVVDNNSQDSTRAIIQSLSARLIFPTKTEYLSENVGFARANNIGVRHADGEYIALLNPDAFPTPRWLEALVTAMDRHPDVGICASKLLAYGLEVIDSAGDGFSTSLKGFKRGEGKETTTYCEMERVFGACAGAALYRRAMIDRIGFLDDMFFLIHEDTDMNFRANLAGWKVMYVPDAVVDHKVHSSIGKMSDLQVYYTLRNSEFVRIKNVPVGMFFKHLTVYLLGCFTEFMYFAVKHARLGIYIRAKLDVVRHLPELLQQRRAIRCQAKVEQRDIEELLTSVWEREFLAGKLRRLLFG